MELKFINDLLLFSSVFLIAVLSISDKAVAIETQTITKIILAKSTPVQTFSAQSQNTDQVTSVSQLSDVQPTDWAFQALQSLVERYGVIAGYPNGTFRGNRAMTRYEFAAGLNAALNRIDELIRVGTENLVNKEDLETLKRLQEEFSAELTTLRGRVDALEARAAELEANQFSTTTKLTGEAIFAVTNAFGNDVKDNNTAFQQRVRLNFNTSFTGRDVLITRLQAGNSQLSNFEFQNTSLSTPDTGVAVTHEGTQTFQAFGDTNNNVILDTLQYRFPVSDNLQIAIAANGGRFDDFTPTLNPFLENFDGGSGSLSTFGQRNPIYRLGGGQGIGVNYKFASLKLTGGYLASEGSSPSDGNGLFNGDYSVLGQLTWTPSSKFSLAFTYLNSYFGAGNFGFDNGKKQSGFTGTAVANGLYGLNNGASTIFGTSIPKPVAANSYGIEASYQMSPKFFISGWVGLTKARIIDYGDGDIWNYAVSFAFLDLGKKGNFGGIVVGAEPYLANLKGADFFPGDESNLLDLPDPKSFDVNIPLHVEAFYKYQVSDNISITPGLIWLTAPNQDNDNSDIFIGTLRTTFTF
jgi:Carbohydrate-selective porin, OprB family/S-layer homology domain